MVPSPGPGISNSKSALHISLILSMRNLATKQKHSVNSEFSIKFLPCSSIPPNKFDLEIVFYWAIYF